MEWYSAITMLLSWPALAAYLSILATLLHAADEVLGDGGPLWNEFGRIAGVRVPAVPGFLGVAVLLPVALGVAAVLGYVFGSMVALSLLIGARLGDTAFSHVGPWLAGVSRPNPGLRSSMLYVVEGVAVIVLLPVCPPFAVAAALGFAAVIPSLWLVGRIGSAVRGARTS